MKKTAPKKHLIGSLLAGLAVAHTSIGIAVDKSGSDPAAGAVIYEKGTWRDRERIGQYTNEKEKLQTQLTGAGSVDQLRKMISDAGYMVTSINEQSDDEVEYEVVKGDTSFEVSAESDGRETLSEVTVTNNLWRADETERAMRDENYQEKELSFDGVTGAKYRDKQYMSSWNSEREALEAALTPGKTVAEYTQMLQEKGYQITSVNEMDGEDTEFEIVKGNQSYEVQLESDESRQIVESVDVTTNIWKSDETEKALARD